MSTTKKKRPYTALNQHFCRFLGFFFLQTGLEHHGSQFPVAVAATPGPEVGVERQKSVKIDFCQFQHCAISSTQLCDSNAFNFKLVTVF